jgi:hypothetical protein
MDTPIEEFSTVETLVEHLVSEAKIAIAYKTMCKKLFADPRIPDVFDNTYEAHGFNIARYGVLNSFVLCLTRLNEMRGDVSRLSIFFDLRKILPDDFKPRFRGAQKMGTRR